MFANCALNTKLLKGSSPREMDAMQEVSAARVRVLANDCCTASIFLGGPPFGNLVFTHSLQTYNSVRKLNVCKLWVKN